MALISVLEAFDVAPSLGVAPTGHRSMSGSGAMAGTTVSLPRVATCCPEKERMCVTHTGSMGGGSAPPTPATPSRRQLVCVANTHIHANPELNDVKLWQVSTLLKVVSFAMYVVPPSCVNSICGRVWKRLQRALTSR